MKSLAPSAVLFSLISLAMASVRQLPEGVKLITTWEELRAHPRGVPIYAEIHSNWENYTDADVAAYRESTKNAADLRCSIYHDGTNQVFRLPSGQSLWSGETARPGTGTTTEYSPNGSPINWSSFGANIDVTGDVGYYNLVQAGCTWTVILDGATVTGTGNQEVASFNDCLNT